jgi:hypothetical protein
MLMSTLHLVIALASISTGCDSFSMKPATSLRSSVTLSSVGSPLDFDISAFYSDDNDDEHDIVTSSYSYISSLQRASSSYDKSFIPWSSSSTSPSLSTMSYSSIASYDDLDDERPAVGTVSDEYTPYALYNNKKSGTTMKEPTVIDMYYAHGIEFENPNDYFQ